MRIRYDARARDEVLRAAEYFDEQISGLGSKFLDEIDKAVKEIASAPLTWPYTRHGTRNRILISPFPYTINYRVVRDELIIVAVAHQSREPDYWADRLE
jgi:plasmid stabilization system protein ParE